MIQEPTNNLDFYKMTKAELQERVEQLSQDVVDLSEGFTNVVKLFTSSRETYSCAGTASV